MPSLAMRVDNLSKRYRIDAPQERYYTPRDTLTRVLAAAATLSVRTCQHFNISTCQPANDEGKPLLYSTVSSHP